MAVLAVAAEAVLRLALQPILKNNTPYLSFFAAVVLVRLMWGRGPALVTTFLGALTAWYLFLEPRYSFAVTDFSNAVGLAVVTMIGVGISLVPTGNWPAPPSLAVSTLEQHVPELIRGSVLRRLAMSAGAALALGTLASLLWADLRRTVNAEQWVRNTYQVLNAAEAVRSSLATAETSQRGYLLTSNPQYLDAYESVLLSGRKSLATLRQLTADHPVQQARLDELEQLLKARLQQLQDGIQTYQNHGLPAAMDLIRNGSGKDLMDQLRARLNSVEEEERQLLNERNGVANSADSRTRWLLGLGSGSLILVLLMAGYSLERNIRRLNAARNLLSRQSRLIDLSHDAIITTAADGSIIGWNSGAQEMYGWTANQAAGKVLHQLLQTQSSVPISEIDRGLHIQERWEGELVHRRADGRQIVTESRHVVDRDRDGHPAGYLEINRDITERKRVEEALRLSEEKFAKAFETNPAAIAITTLDDGIFVDVNDTWLTMFGYTRDEVVGRSAKDVRIWPTAEPREEWAATLRAMGTVRTWEQTFSSKSGAAVPTIFSTTILEIAGQTVVLSTLLDISGRKMAEENLRKSEERFRALTTASSDAVYRMSPDWREMRHLVGHGFINDSQEPNCNWLNEYIHPDDQPLVTAAIHEAIRAKGIFELEHRVLRADGTLGWTFSRAVPLLDAGGNIVEWFGSASDVTKRKRVEEALRESEARFRTLANAIPQLCWMANADGWIFWYNDRWYEYTGTTPQQMEGWGWQSVHDPEALPDVLVRWRDSIARRKPFDMVFPLKGADGVFRPFLTRIVPVLDEGGNVVRWFGTNTDISEQRRIEEALRESEATLRTVTDHARVGLVMIDADRRYVFANNAYAEVLKLPGGELIGRRVPDVMAGVYDQISPRLDRAFTGESVQYQLTVPDGPAGIRHYAITYEPRRTSGHVAGVVVVVVDITDRIEFEVRLEILNARLEERVRERTAQLEESNKELEAFSYSVSHDLRAPLRGIDGWSLALVEDYRDSLAPRAVQYLDRVRSETRRMGNLIDDLLQLSRIGRAKMHWERVDLTAVAEAIAARLREAHPDRNLGIAIEPGMDAFGDPQLLEIALTNLLDNAVKFTGLVADAHIEFRAIESDGEPAFLVRDNGAGFDMAYASKLFGAFQRLHSAAEFPGTGIGLATVQRVVHRHGGKVWADAAPYRGASFYFTLEGVEQERQENHSSHGR